MKAETCRQILDREGLDILEVGCGWHTGTPATFADNVAAIAGVSGLLLSGALMLLALKTVGHAVAKFKPEGTR